MRKEGGMDSTYPKMNQSNISSGKEMQKLTSSLDQLSDEALWQFDMQLETEAMSSLRRRIREILKMDTFTDDHKVQRRIRWVQAAHAAVKAGPGDIVEIGAMEGDSTVEFCRIAEANGRHVLVVDPWTAGTQNCQGHEYDVFVGRTEKWQGNGVLEVLKAESQSSAAIHRLRASKWAFALVDGLHRYASTLCDTMAVRDARVICLDDMNMPPVFQVFHQAADLLGREGIQDPMLAKKWEGYLV